MYYALADFGFFPSERALSEEDKPVRIDGRALKF
jgi:hypothetical protein